MATNILRISLLSLLLAGCGAQILEDVGEITPPRLCSDTVKLFNTFSMRATRIAWKGNAGDPSATLTLELAFYNDKNFPIALSNSGNGVRYSVRFSLQGKGDPFSPKEASGVVLQREVNELKEPRRTGPFSAPRRRTGTGAKADATTQRRNPADQTANVDFRIKPGEPQLGNLVFQLPRNNYLLTIERKFSEKPAAGKPTDQVAVCKIPASDMTGLKPANPPGISGVY